jgi:hypothetical protein
MRAICAWCETVIREDQADPEVTHGICDGCICQLLDITPDQLAAQRAEWMAEEQSRSTEYQDENSAG